MSKAAQVGTDRQGSGLQSGVRPSGSSQWGLGVGSWGRQPQPFRRERWAGSGQVAGHSHWADRGSLKLRETLDPPLGLLTRAPNLPSASHLVLLATCHTAWDDPGDT